MTQVEFSRRAALMLGGLPALMALPVRAQTAPAAPGFAGRAQTIGLGAFQVTTLLGGESMRPDPIGTFGIGVDVELGGADPAVQRPTRLFQQGRPARGPRRPTSPRSRR